MPDPAVAQALVGDLENVATLGKGWLPDADVWLLVRDYRSCLEAAARLPAAWKVADVASAVESAGDRLAMALCDADDQIAASPEARWAWHASSVSERSSYSCDLLLHAAYLDTCLRAMQRGRPQVFVVDDPAIGWEIVRCLRRTGHVTSWQRHGHGRSAMASLGHLARSVATWGRSLVARSRFVASEIRRVNDLRRRRREFPLQLDKLRQADLVLANWATPGHSTTGQKAGKDTYLGGLPALLRQNGYRIAHFALPLDWVYGRAELVEEALRADEPLLMLEDVLRPRDVIAAALRGLCAFRYLDARLVVDGADLSGAVRLALRQELLAGGIPWALLFACVPRRIAELGMRPERLVSPYENQPWERVLRQSWRRVFPQCRVVGVNHSPFPRNYLSFYPSRRDLAEHASVPDTIAVSGPLIAAMFRNFNMPAHRLATIGAVRYDLSPPASPPTRSPQARTIVASAPIDYLETLQLAHMLMMAVHGLPDLHVILCLHPVSRPDFRARLEKELCALLGACRLEIVCVPTRVLLDRAGMVVYTSSGAALEALAAGLPVARLVVPCALNMDKVPAALVNRCTSKEALRAVIQKWCDGELSPPPWDEVRETLLGIYGPVSERDVLSAIHG